MYVSQVFNTPKVRESLNNHNPVYEPITIPNDSPLAAWGVFTAERLLLQAMTAKVPADKLPFIAISGKDTMGASCVSLPQFNIVVINAASWDHLLGAFRAALSRAEILPEKSSGAYNQTILSFQGDPAAVSRNKSGWEFPRLSDPIREALAQELAGLALYYLAMHETAHLLNGHREFRNSLPPIRDDSSQDEIAARNLTLQTLEWDADLMACIRLLEICLQPQIDATSKPNKWILPAKNTFGTPADAFYIANMVVIFAHGFQLKHSDFGPTLVGKTHPPSLFRQTVAAHQLTHNIQIRVADEECEQWLNEAILREAYIYKLWGEIAGLNLKSYLPACVDTWGLGGELISKYEEEWAKIVNDLKKFAHVELAPVTDY